MKCTADSNFDFLSFSLYVLHNPWQVFHAVWKGLKMVPLKKQVKVNVCSIPLEMAKLTSTDKKLLEIIKVLQPQLPHEWEECSGCGQVNSSYPQRKARRALIPLIPVFWHYPYDKRKNSAMPGLLFMNVLGTRQNISSCKR